MAIGIVASNKMSAYLIAQGYEAAGNAVNQLAGIQVYVTTMLIGYILLRFFMLFKDSYKKDKQEKAA